MINEEWDHFYLGMALYVARASKDPSTKVGAVCVDNKKRVLGVGFNGFSRNTLDDYRLNIREKKYKMIIHGEHNCLMNCTGSTEGATMYITHPPCVHCCGILDQYGIKRVVFEEPHGEFAKRWNLQETLEYLKELGISSKTYRRVDA